MRPHRTCLREATSIVLALIVIGSQEASAYIDPGTGSYVLQAIAASLLAAAFVVKSTWKNMTASFKRRFGKQEIDER